MVLDLVLVDKVRDLGRRGIRGIAASIDRAIHEELNFLLYRLVNERFALRIL